MMRMRRFRAALLTVLMLLSMLPACAEQAGEPRTEVLLTFDASSIRDQDTIGIHCLIENTGDTVVQLTSYTFECDGAAVLPSDYKVYDEQSMPVGNRLMPGDVKGVILSARVDRTDREIEMVHCALRYDYAVLYDAATGQPFTASNRPNGHATYDAGSILHTNTVSGDAPLADTRIAVEARIAERTPPTSDDYYCVDDEVEVEIELTNRSNETLYGISLSDRFKGDFQESLIAEIPALAPGETYAASFTRTITEWDARQGRLESRACVLWAPNCFTASSAMTIYACGRMDEVNTEPFPPEDIALELSLVDAPWEVTGAVGDLVTLEYMLENVGNTVMDCREHELMTGLGWDAQIASYADDSQGVDYLNPDTSLLITLTTPITAEDIAKGMIERVFYVHGKIWGGYLPSQIPGDGTNDPNDRYSSNAVVTIPILL